MTEEEKARQHEEDLRRLQGFRLMDDDFMTAFFSDNTADTEFVLRIIMDKPDLHVIRVQTQQVLKNLNGRSAILDIYAVDNNQTEYDIEIQRTDKGAGFKRARHNAALLDSSILQAGQSTEELSEIYVIFITEHDIINKNKPMYLIDRYIKIDNEFVPFADGSHIIYVNGAKQGTETELEKLIHDFSCSAASDMYYSQLAETMRYYKENEKGVAAMCKAMEDMRNETAAKVKRETQIEAALKMIGIGKMTFEEIAECSELPIETVKELADGKGA